MTGTLPFKTPAGEVAFLAAYDAALATTPQLVVATKLDVTEARDRLPDATTAFAARGMELRAVSAATGEGMPALMRTIAELVTATRAAAQAAAAAEATADADLEHAVESPLP